MTNSAKLISVWSPPGSPGKSTVALSIASDLTEAGNKVFLLDADTYAPSLDVLLGLNDHPAGLAAACRLVSQERFDLEQLTRLSTPLAIGNGYLTVMTGLSAESRWAEISSEKLDDLLMVAGENFDFLVLDVASPLSSGTGSLSSPVDRNAVARWAVGFSDFVIGVCGADPVSISRYLTASTLVTELKPKGEFLTLVNRLRSSVLGASAKRQILESLEKLGQITVSGFIPDDPAAADLAMRECLPISVGKRSSQARLALSLFTRTRLLGERTKLEGRIAKRAMAKLN
jgi:MinD-like ATPase involved in chromosome partitioning or flagellar assembly